MTGGRTGGLIFDKLSIQGSFTGMKITISQQPELCQTTMLLDLPPSNVDLTLISIAQQEHTIIHALRPSVFGGLGTGLWGWTHRKLRSSFLKARKQEIAERQLPP